MLRLAILNIIYKLKKKYFKKILVKWTIIIYIKNEWVGGKLLFGL